MIWSNCYFGLLIFMVIACTTVTAYRDIIRFQRSDDDHDKPQGTGEPVDMDPTKTTYYMMAEESLRKYEEESGVKTRYNVLKVNKVTEQVVSGTITKLDFDAGALNCAPDPEPDHFCQFKSVSNVLHCHAEIYSKPWENVREIKSNCSEKKYRFKSKSL